MNDGTKIFDLARWPFVVLCFIGFLSFLSSLLFHCNPKFFILTQNASQLPTDKVSIVSSVLLSPLALNIFGGMVVSLITLLIVFIYKKHSLKKAFAPLEGSYYGYPTGEDEKTFSKEPKSEAKITRERKNLLNIEVRHLVKKDEIWKGRMMMSLEDKNTGHIAWEYTKHPDLEKYGQIFGFKRCMIRRSNKDGIEIYIIGESLFPKDDHYGKEIFKKIYP